MKNKFSTSFSLSSTARQMLAELSQYMGVSKTSVLEILIRESFGKIVEASGELHAALEKHKLA